MSLFRHVNTFVKIIFIFLLYFGMSKIYMWQTFQHTCITALILDFSSQWEEGIPTLLFTSAAFWKDRGREPFTSSLPCWWSVPSFKGQYIWNRLTRGWRVPQTLLCTGTVVIWWVKYMYIGYIQYMYTLLPSMILENKTKQTKILYFTLWLLQYSNR